MLDLRKKYCHDGLGSQPHELGEGEDVIETDWTVMASVLMVAKDGLSSIQGLGRWPAAALDCCRKIYMAGTLPHSSSVNYRVEAIQTAFEIEGMWAVSCRMEQCFVCYLIMLYKSRRGS